MKENPKRGLTRARALRQHRVGGTNLLPLLEQKHARGSDAIAIAD